MYQNPPEEHKKRSLGLISASVVVLIGAIVAFFVISIVGLILRLIMGLQFVGLLSPLYEEPLKVLGLFVLALAFPGTFKSKKEGAILGALAGVLFGVFEIYDFSVLYQTMINAGLLTSGMANLYLISRFFTSLPMHAIASLLFGLGIAYAALGTVRPKLRDTLSGNAMTFMVLSVGFHIVYNLFSIVPALLTRIDLVGVIFGFVAMLAGLYMAYRIYVFIPRSLELMSAIGPRELFLNAMGWKAGKGAVAPDRP